MKTRQLLERTPFRCMRRTSEEALFFSTKRRQLEEQKLDYWDQTILLQAGLLRYLTTEQPTLAPRSSPRAPEVEVQLAKAKASWDKTLLEVKEEPIEPTV